MLIRRTPRWDLPERAATPEHVFLNRRAFVTGAVGLAAAGALSGCGDGGASADAPRPPDPSAVLYPAPRNARFVSDRLPTEESVATTYNNFYEFGSHKRIWKAAQALPVRPWSVKIDGAVARPQTVDIDALLRRVALEERVYRFRCVEAWAMTIPWTGFPIKALMDMVEPLGTAKFIRMETFYDPAVASGQRQIWYPWPYVEAMTIEEAANELAIFATGAYGRPLTPQMGAPIRLVVPWKYGFKSVKSIVRISFTTERPKSFWEEIQPAEYGFWANVNPDVPHPRWSQASEELIGQGLRVPTLKFNGYAAEVAGLYPANADVIYFR